jgi:hypothetical protein
MLPPAPALHALFTVVFLSLLALDSTHARAQAAQSEPQQDEREYQRTIARALQEYQLAHWDEAETLFARAHALKPSARTERGMGLAAFENRKYALAVSHLHAALVDTRRPLTARQRQEVERALEQASTFVARVSLAITPPDASLTLDGVPPVRSSDGALLLDPGEHELIASAPGHEQRSVRIEAAGGMQREVRIALRTFRQLNGGVAEPQAHGLRWTWAAAAGVPVFGALALGIWLSGQGELDTIADDCRAAGGCSDDEIAKRVDDAGLHGRATWTNVFLVLTVASAGTAATLFAIESGALEHERKPGDGTRAGAARRRGGTTVAVLPGAVSVQGRF